MIIDMENRVCIVDSPGSSKSVSETDLSYAAESFVANNFYRPPNSPPIPDSMLSTVVTAGHLTSVRTTMNVARRHGAHCRK